MIIFGKKDVDSEGLRALSDKVDKLEAERKSLYSIIDKLTGCIEETNRRFDGLINQVEALENRIVDLEIKCDKYDDYGMKLITEEEELNAYGRQDDVAGVS